MGKVWKKIVTRVSGILLCAVIMAGCVGVNTVFAVERTYTVKSGDTLKKIAQEQYGSEDWWKVLAQLNADQIKDPNLIYVGWTLRLSADNIDLVEQSECSVSMLVKYLHSSNAEQGSIESFLLRGTWPDGLQVPTKDSVLTPEGAIDWTQAPNGGYTLDPQGQAVKSTCDPHRDEVYDRYGSALGRYTSPVTNSQSYSYEKRSLPYVEDTSSYHQYRMVKEFSDLADCVNECKDANLVSEIQGMVTKYYGGDISKMVVWQGTTASAFGCPGGAVQCEFPLSIDVLCRLGMMCEIP